MKLQRFCLLSVLLILCACSANPDEAPSENLEFVLQTDQTRYLAEPSIGSSYSFSLTATLDNTTAETIYLNLCFPDDTSPIYGVVLADEDAGESAWNPAWGCVGHDESIAVEPGQSYTETYRLEAPNAYSSDGEPIGETEGLFRLVYETLACAESDACAPGSLSSNAFRIELAD